MCDVFFCLWLLDFLQYGLQLDGIPEEISAYQNPPGTLPTFELSPRRLPRARQRQSSTYSLRDSSSDFLRDSIDEIIETEVRTGWCPECMAGGSGVVLAWECGVDV